MITPTARSYRWRRLIALALSSATTATLVLLLLFVNRVHGEPAVPAAPGSIHGHVQDESGRPLSATINVALYAYPFQITNTNGFLQSNLMRVTQPDATGFYAFTGLPSGVYRVGFYDPGVYACSVGACDACPYCFYQQYANQFYRATLPLSSAQDILVMGAPITNIDATMQRGGVLTGTVTLRDVVDHAVSGQVTLYRHTPDGWQVAVTAGLPAYSTPTVTPDVSDFRPIRNFYLSGLAPGRYRLCATLRHTYPTTNAGAVLLWVGCYQRAELAGQAVPTSGVDPLVLEPIESATDISVTAAITLANLNIVVTPFLPDPLPDLPGIAGKVTTTDSWPLPGIRVTAYLSPSIDSGEQVTYAYTNQLGDYRLPLTTGGVYKLNFSEPTSAYGPLHYISTYYQAAPDFAKATLLPWQPGQTLQNIDVTLRAWPQITGTVQLKGGYVAELGWIDVYRQDDSGWTLVKTVYNFCFLVCTDTYNLQTGAYRLALEPGIYRLAASLRIKQQKLTTYYGGSSLAQATDLVIQPEEQRGNVNIELDAEQFETSLRGQVLADGAPRAGVRVELYNYGEDRPFAYVTSGADGAYAVTGLLAGQYLVRALAPDSAYAAVFYGGSPVSWDAQPIMITPEAPGLDVDLNLSHAGGLDGNLRRFDGQPLNGATVRIYWHTGNSEWQSQLPLARALTDTQGNWLIPGLLPGVYRVRYQHGDFLYTSIPYGTPDGNPGWYTPSDLTIQPDAVTHAAMTITAGSFRVLSTPQRIFWPLVTR